LRLFFISLAAALAGTLAALCVLFASTPLFDAGAGPSAADVQGFAILTFVPAFLLCLLLYAPALLWLSRRRQSCETPRYFTLVPAFVLNAPVFLLLFVMLARRGVFAGLSETLLFFAAFAAAGAAFGRGFVWWCRARSR
jgi:hypothetical protein